MKGNIPINKWTVIAVLVLTASLGGDFVSALMRTITALGANYIPAV